MKRSTKGTPAERERQTQSEKCCVLLLKFIALLIGVVDFGPPSGHSQTDDNRASESKKVPPTVLKSHLELIGKTVRVRRAVW